jgi:hypothetical protein
VNTINLFLLELVCLLTAANPLPQASRQGAVVQLGTKQVIQGLTKNVL